jgi:hypothetical protein
MDQPSEHILLVSLLSTDLLSRVVSKEHEADTQNIWAEARNVNAPFWHEPHLVESEDHMST